MMRNTDTKRYYQQVEVILKKKKRITPFDVSIQSSMDAGRFFSHVLSNKDREILSVIGLDVKGKINYYEVVHIGTLSQNMIHPREIMKASILTNSNSIIMAHNHPSGDVTPSAADRKATKKMIEAGLLLGIELLDHIIVSEDKYFSIKENRATYLEDRTHDS
jgi:DNA repair protein RadC